MAVVALLLLAVGALGIDQRLADVLYAWEGHRWALKEAFGTETVVHRTGRTLSLLAWSAAFGAWVFSLHNHSMQTWRKPLGYLVLATLLATAMAVWIKDWSNMDCPWDLTRYGGTRPWVGFFELRPVGLPRGRCFPAGHASGGYAWVALYFFLAVVRPQWRWWGMLTGIAIGLLFGISQQLRGAHFLSHDIWTFALCWFVAVVLYRAFWPADAVFPDRAFKGWDEGVLE